MSSNAPESSVSDFTCPKCNHTSNNLQEHRKHTERAHRPKAVNDYFALLANENAMRKFERDTGHKLNRWWVYL
jgi:hypothetical protein